MTSLHPGSLVDGASRSAPALALPLGNGLLVGAWLCLSWSTLGWLAHRGVDPTARTNGILLLCALLVLAIRARGKLDAFALFRATPRARPLPLALFLLCALGQFLKLRLLDSNLLASMGFAIGTHALAGLYVSRQGWCRGWVFVLFVMALLPFGPHLDAFLGFPARIATAQLVQQVLNAVGVAAKSAEAIVIFENGVANIDLPCSGVKGLWVGGIFFLALTWLERRELGLRWLLAGVAFLASLAIANFARVLCLVVIGFGLGRAPLAALVHLPLGVFGFVASCAFAMLMVRRLPAESAAGFEPHWPPLRWGAFLLAGLLVVLAFGKAADRRSIRAVASANLRLPADWVTLPLTLEQKETALFERNDAHQVGKWRFHAGKRQGTLLVAVTSSFRSHHAPEVCLAASGHTIDGIRRERLEPGVPIKLIDIDHERASAVSWFQSASATTDSLIDRTLAEFLGERRWALVSVLFDERATLDESTSALLRRLHAAVGVSLAAGSQKGS